MRCHVQDARNAQLGHADPRINEHRAARIVHAGDLAVDNGILDAKVLVDPLCEILEVAERVPVARNKIAMAVVDIGERSEAVDFQFKDVVVGVEWLRTE
jgi:hypothetical protein